MSHFAPTVRDLYEAKARSLELELKGGLNGLSREITSARIQKLGLALAGYIEYLHEGRVQFVGGTEVNFLETLGGADRRQAAENSLSRGVCCVVVTKGLQLPDVFLEEARRFGVPILMSQAVSSRAIEEITSFLEERLSPRTTIHGVLLEIFGLGVLIMGESGIGKSECALDLVLRGHRLISDDIVHLKRLGGTQLVGEASQDFPFHMELRGLGIINIRELFGISAVSPRSDVELIMHLVHWGKTGEDRLGVQEKSFSLLDVNVPLFELPVGPGRNLATLVEVGVRIHLLRMQGYRPANDLIEGLEKKIRSSSGERGIENNRSK